MSTQKYHKGDKVKVRVGQEIWSNEKECKSLKLVGKFENTFYYDLRPELTEDIAVVEYSYSERYDGYDVKNYSLKFEKYGSISWFHEDNIIPVGTI